MIITDVEGNKTCACGSYALNKNFAASLSESVVAKITAQIDQCSCANLAMPVLNSKPPAGIKHDSGKDPWHLLPWDAVKVITKILAFGAGKYSERNWELGMDWSRCYRAAIGHLQDWWQTGEPDKETGDSHLWHAGCCVLFLIAYEIRGIGKDDRPNRESDKLNRPETGETFNFGNLPNS